MCKGEPVIHSVVGLGLINLKRRRIVQVHEG